MCVRRINEDEFLYSVSEESIMKTWDNNDIEDHEFSDTYKNFREDLIRRAGENGNNKKTGMAGNEHEERRNGEACGEIVSMSYLSRKKKWYRRPAGIAAAVAAAIILSVGAYAISGLFHIKSQEYTGDVGEYTYEFEAPEGTMVQPMRLVPNYLPEGYDYLQEHFKDSDGIKKYHKEDGSGGLTIALDNYNSSQTFSYVSSVENTEINGVKTDILTRNGDVSYNHILLMFYEDLGQIVRIYGHSDLSLEELKKIAENLVLEPTGEEPYQAFVQERETYDAEPVLIEDGRKVQVGEAMEYVGGMANKKLSFTVTDIDIRDDISGLPEKYFTDYERISSLLDENGKFAPYERTEPVWENNALVEKSTGESYPAFAYITMEITNLSDEPLTDEFVYAKLVYENSETGEEEVEMAEGLGNETVYYDGSDYLDGVYNIKLYHSDFDAGETRTVHLGVLFMKERQEEAYLNFFDWTNTMDTCYVKLIP